MHWVFTFWISVYLVEGSDYSDRELNDANLQQQLYLSTPMEDTSNTQTRRLENEANLTLVRWKG